MAVSNESMRTIKILLIGDSGAGKSSLLLRYAENKFLNEDECEATVGVDFRQFRKTIKGQSTKLCVWDTAGQERFRSMTSSFYRDAAVVFLVFDISMRSSFDSLDAWVSEIDKNCGDTVIRCLVANKMDIQEGDCQVPSSEAMAYAARLQLSYREVSAKTMMGVRELFDEFSEKALDVPPAARSSSGNIRLSSTNCASNALQTSSSSACSC